MQCLKPRGSPVNCIDVPTGNESSFTTCAVQEASAQSLVNTTISQLPLVLARHLKLARSFHVLLQLLSLRVPSSSVLTMVVELSLSQPPSPETDSATGSRAMTQREACMAVSTREVAPKLAVTCRPSHHIATKPRWRRRDVPGGKFVGRHSIRKPAHAHLRYRHPMLVRPVIVRPMNAVQSRRLAQEMEDTYRRALTGGPFYLLAWLIVGIYGNAFARTPLASWLLAFVFAALAGLRFLHRPIADAGGHADDAARVRWLRLHWGIVALTTLLWGAVFCWTLLDSDFGNARTASLLSTLGLATAVAHAFSMRRGFALACIALLYAPGLLVLWANPADRATGLVMMVYLAYVLISLVRSHAEYQQRLDLDQELRDQRDLFSQQSKIDPLTELANRRHFSNVLAEASERALRTGGALTLLVLDLDHFKKINDTHGHAIGDACLVAIAGRLRSLFSGEDDLPARLGGEEFGVVLDRQDLATAARRAEHFRANLAEHPIALHGSTLDGNALDGMVLAMTASIGIADSDSAIQRDVDALYSAADRAVYRAKAAGRNRVGADEPALEMALAMAENTP